MKMQIAKFTIEVGFDADDVAAMPNVNYGGSPETALFVFGEDIRTAVTEGVRKMIKGYDGTPLGDAFIYWCRLEIEKAENAQNFEPF